MKLKVMATTDFQWSGARLVVEHQDPWKTFLSGDPRHQIILGQQPNYLPELYILFLPFGLMTLAKAACAWAIINVIMAIISARLAARIFALDQNQALMSTLLFLASTPLRVTLANGQQGILILFFLSASIYCGTSLWRGIWLGLSYAKYSFAPVFVFSWALERRYKALLISVIPPALGCAAVYCLISSSALDVALGPLRVSQIAFSGSAGYADLMTIIQMILPATGAHAALWAKVPELLAVLASAAAVIWIHGRGCIEPIRSALVMVLTILFFKHLNYDFVVLMLPLAVTVRASQSPARTAAIGVILYFWFLSSLTNRLVHWPSLPILIIHASMLAFLALAILLKFARTAELVREDPNSIRHGRGSEAIADFGSSQAASS
jgi:hypothetical protein